MSDELLRSGVVELRPAIRELRVDGQAVAIERRAFDLLHYLMQHADRVVDKDELWRQVWDARPVTDSVLPQAISRIRKALGGEPEAFLTTVYGVGYHFSQPVQRLQSPAVGSASKASPDLPTLTALASRWPVRVLAAGLLVLGLLLWSPWRDTSRSEPIRVAVLPIVNATGQDELDWFTLGGLSLIDQALADSGSQRVATATVLATLRRYPERTEPNDQAQLLRLSTGAERVLIPRLTARDGRYRLSLTTLENPDDPFSLEVDGDDISVLAVAVGTSLSESLSRWKGSERARRGLVTDDPFLNEAFARGLDARLRGRHEDAARFFDTVLAAVPDLHQAKYHLSLVTRRLGDWDYTDQLNKELLAAAEANGDRGMLAAAQSVSGILAWRRGDKEAAEAWYTQALGNYQALNNQDYIASTHANLAILASTRGEYAKAEGLFLEALVHYEQINDRYNQATTLKNLGTLFNDQGQFDAAEDYLSRAQEIRQQLSLPLEVAMTLSNLADIKMARGQWPEALAYQQRVLVTAVEYDDPVLECQARADLSASLRSLGRLSEARLSAAQALTIARELSHPPNEAFALIEQGRAELALGNFASAAAMFEESAEIYHRIQEPLGQARAMIARSEAMLELSELEAVGELLSAASEIIDASELDRLRAELALAQGLLAAKLGDTETATRQMKQAYRQAQSGDSPILGLEVGGRLGLYLMASAGDDPFLPELAEELAGHPDASPRALDFLSNFHQQAEPTYAMSLAEARKRLLGEGWSLADEERLKRLAEQAAEAP